MRDVLDAVTADVEAAGKRREAMRALDPTLTAVMDSLGADARMRCIWIDGEVVAGKPPEPDPGVTISADFYLMAVNLGAKKK